MRERKDDDHPARYQLSMKMPKYIEYAMGLLFSLACTATFSQTPATGPQLLTIYKTVDRNGGTKTTEMVAGLINMDAIYLHGGNCGQMTGMIKVEGIQFSSSGGTLESFRFTDKNGSQWSVPTNIGSLSNVARQRANSFIRVGRTYFSHIQVCGSGGFASLISLYDPSITFGPN